jgi:hypothetical protein
MTAPRVEAHKDGASCIECSIRGMRSDHIAQTVIEVDMIGLQSNYRTNSSSSGRSLWPERVVACLSAFLREMGGGGTDDAVGHRHVPRLCDQSGQ